MILITGAFGQDGIILQKKLAKSEKLVLVARNRPSKDFSYNGILEIGDLQDKRVIKDILKKYKISHIFNFATNSFVERDIDYSASFINRCSIFDNIIESIIDLNLKDRIWIFHPLSSEIFGVPENETQGINTRIAPINPYGIQKSLELIKCRYLVQQGFKIFHPIMFNHESIYRKENYFTKKALNHILAIKANKKQETLFFYNSGSSRDFSYANSFIEAMLIAMNSRLIGDEVFGSGINLTILEFIEHSLGYLDIPYTIKKEKQSNLISIYSGEQEIAKEISRSEIDEKRKFKFDGVHKNDHFKKTEFIGGKILIEKLIDEIK